MQKNRVFNLLSYQIYVCYVLCTWNPTHVSEILSRSKVSHHFFVLSCLFELHNIYLIRPYPRIVEIKYYIYIYVQNEKPLNMKYTEKNKLQYFEKNNRKNYKIILFCKVLPSIVSHKTRKAFRKCFISSDFVELFPLIILIKKNILNFIEKWRIYSQNIKYTIYRTMFATQSILQIALVLFPKDAAWKALQKL